MIEIIVALGALTIILTTAAIAVTAAISNAEESKKHNLAAMFSQQGLEIVRQMRDADWNTFNNFSGTYCLEKSCTQITASGNCGAANSDCGKNIDSYFSRSVIITRNDNLCSVPGTPATRVVSLVSWNDSKCSAGDMCRNVKSETCFGNLNGDSGL